MRGGTDSRGPMDAEPDVSLAGDGRLPGVHAHSDAHLHPAGPIVRGERALRGDRRRDRILRAPEHDEEGVSLAVDLAPARCREGFAKQTLLSGEDAGVALVELLHQPRRALDVREEKGDGPRRQLEFRVLREHPRLLARELEIDHFAGQLGLDLAQVAPAGGGAGGGVRQEAARLVDRDRERRPGELAATRVALLRLLRQRSGDHGVERDRQLGPLGARRRRLCVSRCANTTAMSESRRNGGCPTRHS